MDEIITKPSETFKLIASLIASRAMRDEVWSYGEHVCVDLRKLLRERKITESCQCVCAAHIKMLLSTDRYGRQLPTAANTLTKWLFNNYPEHITSVARCGNEKWLDYKHAWVLSMAAHFEAIGQ